MAFETLEDVKQHCEKSLNSKPTLIVLDNQIGEAQVPPKRTYSLVLNILPPDDGLAEAKLLKELESELISEGFESKVNSGKISGGGYHLELQVNDKRSPKYSKGQMVKFQGDLSKPATEFRVKGFSWNKTIKEFEYNLYDEATGEGFSTVRETHINKD
jgi:hypothetical protein